MSAILGLQASKEAELAALREQQLKAEAEAHAQAVWFGQIWEPCFFLEQYCTWI